MKVSSVIPASGTVSGSLKSSIVSGLVSNSVTIPVSRRNSDIWRSMQNVMVDAPENSPLGSNLSKKTKFRNMETGRNVPRVNLKIVN
jgi:hypothetical protein